MKSFQRSEENKHVISYSRNIHMNLCFKKKTGWFSMCKVLKINSPTFSGHFNFFLSVSLNLKTL